MPVWHGTKVVWGDRLLDPHCDFEMWPHLWPCPLIFKVRLTWNERDVRQLYGWPTLRLSTLTSFMAMTLKFQRQILKQLYPRNGRADCHGTRGISVNRMLDSHCDIELDLNHDLDLGFSIFEIAVFRNERADQHGTKGILVDRMLSKLGDLELWLWPWIWRSNV